MRSSNQSRSSLRSSSRVLDRLGKRKFNAAFFTSGDSREPELAGILSSLMGSMITMLIVIVIAWNIRKQLKRGDMVLTGVSGAIAALLEGFYGMTESTAGKWAKQIFPWFATIFLLVLFVNLQELVPGPDGFGYLHESDHGYPKQVLLGGALETIVKPAEGEEAHDEEEVAPQAWSQEALPQDG